MCIYTFYIAFFINETKITNICFIYQIMLVSSKQGLVPKKLVFQVPMKVYEYTVHSELYPNPPNGNSCPKRLCEGIDPLSVKT